jgi:acetate kinase
MFILVFNSGSSSLKFKLFELDGLRVAASGSLTNYSAGNYQLNFVSDLEKLSKTITAPEYTIGPKLILDWLIETKLVDDINSIRLFGHRIVHGGTHYTKATRLTDQVIQDLIDLSDLAPLHNPASLKVVDFLRHEYPAISQTACFDTAFHASLPPEAYTYPVPEELAGNNIRKYGFHGLSVKYANHLLQNEINEPAAKTIICHLGSGSSLTAVRYNQSLDQSMGFSPLGGLVMSTRSGDLDPGLVLYLQKRYKLTPEELEDKLNKHSGLLAISGESPNLHDLLKLEHDNPKAALAVEIYIRKIVMTIGSFTALLGGLDDLVFTGTIGLKSSLIRQKIITRLGYLGVKLDLTKNSLVDDNFEASGIQRLSSPASSARIWALMADEERQIATECVQLLFS